MMGQGELGLRSTLLQMQFRDRTEIGMEMEDLEGNSANYWSRANTAKVAQAAKTSTQICVAWTSKESADLEISAILCTWKPMNQDDENVRKDTPFQVYLSANTLERNSKTDRQGLPKRKKENLALAW